MDSTPTNAAQTVWTEIAPGLYVRQNTPQVKVLNDRFVEQITAGAPTYFVRTIRALAAESRREEKKR